jgi:hypothetical protein
VRRAPTHYHICPLHMEESRYDPTCYGKEGATVVRPSPSSTSSAALSTTPRVPRAGRAHGTTGPRHSGRYVERCLFRILYHQSITIVAHGQLVLGDTFGYLDNFCILEGPSDREACTHLHTPCIRARAQAYHKRRKKVLMYFFSLPNSYAPRASHCLLASHISL